MRDLDDLEIGPAVWLHTARGGYGFRARILCDVTGFAGKKVKIRPLLKDGGRDGEIAVSPEHVAPMGEMDEMRRALWDEKFGVAVASGKGESDGCP